MFCVVDGDKTGANPRFYDLGIGSHLRIQAPQSAWAAA
jgi:hypothetical protein